MTAHRVGVALSLISASMALLPRVQALTAVSPAVLEISAPERVATLTLANSGVYAVRVQASVFLWAHTEAADKREPTEELMVVPAVAELPPGKTQVFRIALRQPAPSNRERSYRLVLNELSSPAAELTAGDLKFSLSHNVPVMVAPSATITHRIAWSPCRRPPSDASAPQNCLRLTNEGNHRIKVGSVLLRWPGGSETLRLPAPLLLLAGGTQRLELASSVPTTELQAVMLHDTDARPINTVAQTRP